MIDDPDFESKGYLNEISIMDIMPTILASQGVAIPTDVDGNVLSVKKVAEAQQPIEQAIKEQIYYGEEIKN